MANWGGGGEGYWLREPIARQMQEEIVNALRLGQRSRASRLLSELGNRNQALKAGHFIPILQYCARTPDPLVGVIFAWLSFAHSRSFLPYRVFWMFI